jgi:hypothetical protein
VQCRWTATRTRTRTRTRTVRAQGIGVRATYVVLARGRNGIDELLLVHVVLAIVGLMGVLQKLSPGAIRQLWFGRGAHQRLLDLLRDGGHCVRVCNELISSRLLAVKQMSAASPSQCRTCPFRIPTYPFPMANSQENAIYARSG